MSTKNITSATHNAAAVAGITRFTCSLSRTVTPVVCGDGQVFADAATTGGWDVSATLEGVDRINLQALEGDSAASLVVVHPASDGGGTAKTFTITGTVPHGYSETTPEPGNPGDASINFNSFSSDGTTNPITIT
jgi:hypothetical protein